MEKHRLLKKQLERHFAEDYEINGDLSSFVNEVNKTYLIYENDRKLLEKVMELSSDELFEAFLRLKKANEELLEEIENHKRTEQKLIIARDKAEESDRLKTAFVANLSHEIRTPLNAILGFSDLISQDNLTKDKKELFRDNIKKGGETLSKLIDDIIDISIIEAGKFKIENHRFKLMDIFWELKHSFQKEVDISEKNIKLIVDVDDDDKDMIINSDKFRLKQVLTNLLSNGIKFTEEGHVRFGYRSSNNGILSIFVEDTGIGIKKEDQASIFKRFNKVDAKNKKIYRGAGLGLSISKNIIDLMKGDINIKSVPDKGTVFTFELPLIK